MILITLNAAILGAGANYANRLGLDDGRWNLTQFTPLSSPVFDQISAGDHHTLAIAGNAAYCWGHNNRGKCGFPKSQYQVSAPQEIPGLKNIKVVQAAAGYDHSVFLGDNGSVYTFGKNTSGQLGAPGASGESVKMPEFSEKIVHVAASESLTVAVGASGKVYAFGYCSYYRCGEQFNGKMLLTPTQIDLSFLVAKVFLTVHGAYFATQDGRTYVMGYNYFGELCYSGNYYGVSAPVYIGVNYLQKVSSGSTHAVLFTEEALAYGCGSHGHAVFGTYGASAFAPLVLSKQAQDAAAVDAGTLLIENGKLRRTGYSGYGEMNFQGYCYAFEDAGVEAQKVECYKDACFVRQ